MKGKSKKSTYSTTFGIDPKRTDFPKRKSAFKLWAGRGLNPRPSDYESPALTPELPALVINKFEPPTMHFILRLASIFCKKNKMVAEKHL